MYSLGLYEKAMPHYLTIREKLQCTKECGFDYMEISIDETDEKLNRLNMSTKERLDIVKSMYEVGVPIRSMCLSGHRKYPLGSMNEETRKKGMEIMKKAIELADDLGIRIIQLAGYDVYYEDSSEKTEEYFFANLYQAVNMAAKKGIILAFETMETEFMNTVEKAMEYVNEINSPYLQVYPDCGNMTNAAYKYGKNVLDDIALGEGHIVAMHLKETVPGKFREIPFGTGHVDFEEIVRKSYSIGVRRYLAEFWYVGNEDWKEEIKRTKEFMDSIFKGI